MGLTTAKSHFNDLHNVHIWVNMDDSVSMAYLNKLGGGPHQLDALARPIWLRCLYRNIHISAAFVAGKTNVEADELSRKDFQGDLEGSFAPHIFDRVVSHSQICQFLYICHTELNHTYWLLTLIPLSGMTIYFISFHLSAWWQRF